MRKFKTFLIFSLFFFTVNVQAAHAEAIKYKGHKIGGVVIKLPDSMEMFKKFPIHEGEGQVFRSTDKCSGFRATLLVSEAPSANEAEANSLRESVSKFPNDPEIQKMLESYKESIIEIEISSSKKHVKNFKLRSTEAIKLGTNDLITIEYSGLLHGHPVIGRKYESIDLNNSVYSFNVVDHEACYQSRFLQLVQSIESVTFRQE